MNALYTLTTFAFKTIENVFLENKWLREIHSEFRNASEVVWC